MAVPTRMAEPAAEPVAGVAGEHAIPAGAVPLAVLRQWSDALAAAGLFGEALHVHPSAERADVVRRAELAVLAEDPHTALSLLAELADARTPRTAPVSAPGLPDAKVEGRPSPWLDLLSCAARVLAGQHAVLPDVVRAAAAVQPSPGVSWVLALAAIAAGDLPEAAPAAVRARAGGCRDLRILAICAADRSIDGDDWAAIELVRGAQRVALPDEDPAGLVVDLLDRAGAREDAQRVAARAAADTSLPPPARSAWSAAARRVGAGRKQLLRRSMAAVADLAARRRDGSPEQWAVGSGAGLVCRCYGSTGWIGDSRLLYVDRHLDQVLPAPVAGMDARLLRCRATNLTFLDLPGRQLTLPVVSAPGPAVRGAVAGPFADPDADPGASPTPGMGVSLGMALPA